MANGWICVNKPEGITSAQVINRIKRAFPKGTRIGHAGTLDKFACGVLPIAVGGATKTIPWIMDAEKVYTFTIRWGIQTSTDDRDGDVIFDGGLLPSPNEIQRVLPTLIGDIDQIPPVFSALKIDGKRASDRVRRGETVTLAARQIQIYALQLISHQTDSATFQVRCSKGTYVRALTRDLAAALGTVGYVSFLRRDQVGAFNLTQSVSFDPKAYLDEAVLAEIRHAMIPLNELFADIPRFQCPDTQIPLIRNGASFPLDLADASAAFAMLDNTVIALGHIKDQQFHPKNVFLTHYII